MKVEDNGDLCLGVLDLWPETDPTLSHYKIIDFSRESQIAAWYALKSKFKVWFCRSSYRVEITEFHHLVKDMRIH